MGYLNNTTRVLDAILTKKGRELLSSGADFTVIKFALGDDEIDYGLWDTTHTLGTDYYGAAIDNLPALEPFNDPSEIMKYKVVTRHTEGCRAMALLVDSADAGKLARSTETSLDTSLGGLVWYSGDQNNISVEGAQGYLGGGSQPGGGRSFGISHKDNKSDMGGKVDYDYYSSETFTVTLLDASVACLAPAYASNDTFIDTEYGTDVQLARWVPFVDNVQHISQTIRNVDFVQGNTFGFPGTGQELFLYPKQISDTHLTNPAKTSIIITGEISGAVMQFPVTIHYIKD